jgi:hypothetical protein
MRVRTRAVAGRAGESTRVGRGYGVGKMVENAGGVWETVVAAVCGVVEQQLPPTRSLALPSAACAMRTNPNPTRQPRNHDHQS